MKRIIPIVLLAFLLAVPAQAQDAPPVPEGRHRERLEQLRRIKMIEALELDEEQAVRLTVREKEFREKEREILDQRKKLMEDLREMVEDGAEDAALRAQLAKLEEIGSRFVREKHAYLLSLNDFLSMKQIAKMVLFEQKFAQEVRRLLENARKPGRR